VGLLGTFSIQTLLVVLVLVKGTGKTQAGGVSNALQDWELPNSAIATRFDATRKSTGITNGACTLLEEKHRRKRPYLAFRNHIHEVII